MRFCTSRGLLVGGQRRLPSDLCEYNVGDGAGCNRLRCPHCASWVRSGPPGAHWRENAPGDIVALYASEDWSAFPFIAQGRAELRLYICKCNLWEERDQHFLENDHEEAGEPDLPWACAGHETPALPVTLGPFVISEQTDWAQVVRQILAGVCPRPLEQAHEGPARWLAWLHSYLHGLPVAERLSAAVAAHADDADADVIARVLHFFRGFPAAPGVERLLARAQAAPERVALRYRVPEGASTFWDLLVRMLAQRSDEMDDTDRRVVALVREVMLLPLTSLVGAESDVVKDTFEQLAQAEAFDESDLLFIAENAARIEAAGPGRWAGLMRTLVRRHRGDNDLGHLVVIAGIALIESGRVDRGAFRAWIARTRYRIDEWAPPLEAALGPASPA